MPGIVIVHRIGDRIPALAGMAVSNSYEILNPDRTLTRSFEFPAELWNRTPPASEIFLAGSVTPGQIDFVNSS